MDRKQTPQGTTLQATQAGAGAQAEEGPSEQQKKITSYEEAFHRIKDATGVSDMVEVVIRYAVLLLLLHEYIWSSQRTLNVQTVH